MLKKARFIANRAFSSKINFITSSLLFQKKLSTFYSLNQTHS